MTPELDALWWLGPDIRLAARCLNTLFPRYATEDIIASDITLALLDHDLVLTVEEIEPGGTRAWWLMLLGFQRVRAELEYTKEIA